MQHIAIIIRWILIHFKIIIITSSSLPKREVSNGLYGEKDGILLVLPLILVQVAKTICEGITRIDRESKSKEDRTFKEAKLYEDGPHLAASKVDNNFDFSTGLVENPFALHLFDISSCIG